MKVYITVEVEKGDIEDDKQGMSRKNYQSLQDVIHNLRLDGIHVQYKETDIPRWKRASET
jgi:hypothetical protein